MVSRISLPTPEQITTEYNELFQSGVGSLKQFKASLSLKEGARSRFCHPHTVPFAIMEHVGEELNRLEELGILRKVDHAELAASIVPVSKKDGGMRLCGNYKVTINQALQVDQYPLPKPSNLFAILTGGQKFTKLDLTST